MAEMKSAPILGWSDPFLFVARDLRPVIGHSHWLRKQVDIRYSYRKITS